MSARHGAATSAAIALAVAFALMMPGPAAGSTPAGTASSASGSAGSTLHCGNETLPPAPQGGKWRCSFDDEFDSTTGDAADLNRSWWTPQTTASSGFTSGAGDYRACYRDSTDNIAVSGGALDLTARKEPAPVQCGAQFSSQYTAGMVSTLSKFDQTYGRFEVRARLPQTSLPGLQETLWLYPQNLTYGRWPASGEVDLAEFYSRYSLLDVPFIHYSYDASTTAPLTGTNVTTANCPINPSQYNDYAVVWEPGRFTITINGNTCLVDNYKASGGLPPAAPFDQPFFILLTQALGVGANAYNPQVTPLPATTSIDYVRAWTSKAPGTPQPPAPPTLLGLPPPPAPPAAPSNLRVSPRTFTLAGRRVGGRCVKASRTNREHRRCSRPIRLRVSYRLDAPANVTIAVTRSVPGRRVGGHCVRATRRNREHHRCTRPVALPGTLAANGEKGANRFTFDGRIGGRKLTSGHYRLTATPTANGRVGEPRGAAFSISR